MLFLLRCITVWVFLKKEEENTKYKTTYRKYMIENWTSFMISNITFLTQFLQRLTFVTRPPELRAVTESCTIDFYISTTKVWMTLLQWINSSQRKRTKENGIVAKDEVRWTFNPLSSNKRLSQYLDAVGRELMYPLVCRTRPCYWCAQIVDPTIWIDKKKLTKNGIGWIE